MTAALSDSQSADWLLLLFLELSTFIFCFLCNLLCDSSLLLVDEHPWLILTAPLDFCALTQWSNAEYSCCTALNWSSRGLLEQESSLSTCPFHLSSTYHIAVKTNPYGFSTFQHLDPQKWMDVGIWNAGKFPRFVLTVSSGLFPLHFRWNDWIATVTITSKARGWICCWYFRMWGNYRGKTEWMNLQHTALL